MNRACALSYVVAKLALCSQQGLRSQIYMLLPLPQFRSVVYLVFMHTEMQVCIHLFDGFS